MINLCLLLIINGLQFNHNWSFKPFLSRALKRSHFCRRLSAKKLAVRLMTQLGDGPYTAFAVRNFSCLCERQFRFRNHSLGYLLCSLLALVVYVGVENLLVSKLGLLCENFLRNLHQSFSCKLALVWLADSSCFQGHCDLKVFFVVYDSALLP